MARPSNRHERANRSATSRGCARPCDETRLDIGAPHAAGGTSGPLGVVVVPTSIVLADDHIQFRTALRSLLDEQPGLKVLAEFGDGADLLQAFQSGRLGCAPDLIVMDVRMPHMSGIEAARLIAEMQPSPHILALSMHQEEQFVQAMLAAGARGYALKGDPLPDLLRAIEKVAAGGYYMSPALPGGRPPGSGAI